MSNVTQLVKPWPWMKKIFTARKQSCGKVMFLHLSVILFTGERGVVSYHAPGPHYISSCTGVDTQLVLGQHTGNIKCMMG